MLILICCLILIFHLQSILILTLILLTKAPKHPHVLQISDKITMHYIFSHDSDEETGEWPKARKREVIYGS